MKKREIFLLSSLAFSMGVIVGFLMSPVKEGVCNIIGNHTTINDDIKNPISVEEEREEKAL